MGLTEKEVRERLGLKDADEYRVDAIRSIIDCRYFSYRQKLELIDSRRVTGRTTNLIVQAVVDISNGTEIEVHSKFDHEKKRLAADLQLACEQAGLKVIWGGGALRLRRPSQSEFRMLEDHRPNRGYGGK